MSDDQTRSTHDDGRRDMLQKAVLAIMTLLSGVGMIGLGVVGHWAAAGISGVVAVIFGTLMLANLDTLDVSVGRAGFRYRIRRHKPVRADARYEIREPANPPPSRGQDVA